MSLNVCVAYIFLFWIAIWPLWESNCPFSARDVSIRVQLFRVSFPLKSLMGGVGFLSIFYNLSHDYHVTLKKKKAKMSDSEESAQTMPVLQKRPRLSIPSHVDGSEEETVHMLYQNYFPG